MNFQELTDAYKKRIDEFLLQIEEKCAKRNGSTILPQTPSYLEEVIIPIFKSLAEIIRKKGVKIPTTQTYRPIKGYYRIKIGLTTVGGFSVPGNGDYAIYFTPMKNANPIGDRQLVSDTEELLQLINNQLKAKQQLIT